LRLLTQSLAPAKDERFALALALAVASGRAERLSPPFIDAGRRRLPERQRFHGRRRARRFRAAAFRG
jgi:hypothetical protein